MQLQSWLIFNFCKWQTYEKICATTNDMLKPHASQFQEKHWLSWTIAIFQNYK